MSVDPETTVSQETKALISWDPATAQESEGVSIEVTHPGVLPTSPRVPGLLTFMTNVDNSSYCYLTAEGSVLSRDRPQPDADPSLTIRPKIPVDYGSAYLADTLNLTKGLIPSDHGPIQVRSVDLFSGGVLDQTFPTMLLCRSAPKEYTLGQLDLQPTNKQQTLDTTSISGKDPLSFQGVMLSDFKTQPKQNGDGPSEQPTMTCTAKWIFVKQPTAAESSLVKDSQRMATDAQAAEPQAEIAVD